MRRAVPLPNAANLRPPKAGTSLIGDAFSGPQTDPNAWNRAASIGGGAGDGNGCLTAGTNATPGTSLPACGAAAPSDPSGQGVLQVIDPTYDAVGMVVNTTPLSTANGLQITFTYYCYDGTTPGADGLGVFLADATYAAPTTTGGNGGGVGVLNVNNSSGIPNVYLVAGLDEWGNFSAPGANGGSGATGGPGQTPETLAFRGTSSNSFPYLGGVTDGNGNPASLPFNWDQPGSTRPANAPTIRLTLTKAGLLTAEIDRHDGNNFQTYFSKNIVGVAGQPAVPARVYVGFAGATGGAYSRKQIGGFNVSTLAPASTFTPKQIPNLTAWYDASDPSNVTQSNGKVSALADSSGNNNTLVQSNAANQPSYEASGGIGALGSIAFGGTNFLLSSNGSFSSKLFGESTVFAVGNAGNTHNARVLLWSGNPASNPRWALQSLNNHMAFAFDASTGQLTSNELAWGGAIWTAGGSLTGKSQFLRKNGNTIASTKSVATATGTTSYPVALGAMASGAAGSAGFQGNVGEVLIFNRALTAIETSYVEGYLACKWGLQNRLPANHAFKTLCPQSAPPGTPLPTPKPIAGGLQNPPELRSSNGVLVFNVTAQQDNATGNPELSYNGSTVPPTLRLLPGDTLFVNLTNNLPVPNGQNYTNATNLHFHGLHVTPNAPGDDSIDMLANPGQTLHYRVPIPANAPPGLFWYHSHAHGEAERQNLAGMSGALVVDGIARYVPAVANLPERVMVVRDAEPPGTPLPNAALNELMAMRWSMQHASMMSMAGMRSTSTNDEHRNPYVTIDPLYRAFKRPAADTHCQTTEMPAKVWTVNGQTNPTIGIRPGEQQFWRIVNAGSDTFLDLAVDNAQLDIVAVDGVPISSGMNVPAQMLVPHWIVPPASRVEFIVTGPPAGKTAYLRTNCFDDGPSGPAMPAQTLAQLNPNASSTDIVGQRTFWGKMPAFHTAAFVKAHAVARTQTIYYSDQNNINGVPYDPSAPPLFYAQSGTVEEWTIINNSAQGHTFHIHQIHFLVEAINGITQGQQFLMDNVNVPAATAAGPGTVKVLVDFTDPLVVGTFLLHCHVLSHEDGGMMAKIRVGTAPPLVLSPSSVAFKSVAAAPQTVTVSGGQSPYQISGCSGVVNASINGNKISLVPAAAGACVLLVSDQSGLGGNVSITVAATAPIVKLQPTSVSFTSPSGAAQDVTISGGTPPYGAVGCVGTVTAAIHGSTMTVTPVAGGSCTITVNDAANNTNNLAVSVNIPTGGLPMDNLTFHQNPMRTGWYQNETQLNVSTVSSSNFKLRARLVAPSGMPAFGKVYAQPLFVTNEKLGDGTVHNLVIVATSTDQVYAFDDQTRAMVWHRSFTNPPSVRQQLWTDTNCPDVNPDVGITGTPVIDRTLDRMYVVVPTDDGGTFHMRLHAISLNSGTEAQDKNGIVIGPTDITGTITVNGNAASIDPAVNYNRGALLEANGNIYVALGSHCDNGGAPGGTHGWIISYNASNLQPTGNLVALTVNDGSGAFLGSPWMSGYGPAADASGNLFFATGNGPFNGITQFGMSIVQVPGNLDITSTSNNGTYFTPKGAYGDGVAADQDLGSGGVLLFPDQPGNAPHLLAQGGKCGVGTGNGGTNGCQLYIINRDNMGKQQTGDAGAAFHMDTGCGMWGGPAYFADAAANQYLVYGCGNPLAAYKLLTSSGVSLSMASQSNSTGCCEGRDSGSQPIVSSNGTTAGSAIVWALHTPGNGGGSCTSANPDCIILYAYDGSNMAHSAGTCLANNNAQCIFASPVGPWMDASGVWIGGALVSPLVANGNVYVPYDGGVAVFGLK